MNRNLIIGIVFGVVIVVLGTMLFNGTRPATDGGTRAAAPVSEPATPSTTSP
ncbi:hypothetical protein [Devosia sp. UYZn731]|uniref:hypothetical protein n=1 Tax=Devosia sp. UYZn731 TaxID=3156345 RepID=UPI00339581DD